MAKVNKKYRKERAKAKELKRVLRRLEKVIPEGVIEYHEFDNGESYVIVGKRPLTLKERLEDMSFKRKVERAGISGSIKMKLLENENEKLTVEVSTRRMNEVVQRIEGKDLGNVELHELTIYCHNQTEAAKSLQADALIKAWEDLTLSVETAYRACNAGVFLPPGVTGAG